MLHKILSCLDNNSKGDVFAIVMGMFDWKQAFDRQCPKLGVESFMRNGVRPSLIPMLINYFQDRKMFVKWKGEVTEMRNLNGGGPQGCTWGILEYLSQTNNNVDFIPPDERYKFIDDLTTLEIVNLLSVGLTSYNFKTHIASNIPTHNQVIPAQNLKSQEYLEKLNKWSEDNKMMLNLDKTKTMIINYTDNYKFTTNLHLSDKNIEVVSKTKLLGVILTNDLKWSANTNYLIKKAYACMRMIHKLVEFDMPTSEMVLIYILYIRSIIEQSCQIWHSSLTQEDSDNLERVQKTALKTILGNDYISYEDALSETDLSTLSERRDALCLKFAVKSHKCSKTSDMFPLNRVISNTRLPQEKFQVFRGNTSRFDKSAIPYMQKLLNEHFKEGAKKP